MKEILYIYITKEIGKRRDKKTKREGGGDADGGGDQWRR